MTAAQRREAANAILTEFETLVQRTSALYEQAPVEERTKDLSLAYSASRSIEKAADAIMRAVPGAESQKFSPAWLAARLAKRAGA